MSKHRSRRFTASSNAGLSIVELLVGIAIGLFILAGATLVTTGQVTENRQLILETQIQQDLRSASDLMAVDLRRGGFWGNAQRALWPAAGAAPALSPYRPLWITTNGSGDTEINYAISRSAMPIAYGGGGEDDNEGSNERFGFSWNSAAGTLEARLGDAGWQTMTDPDVMTVTQFNATVVPQVLVVPCSKLCPAGGTACWPRQTVRDLNIAIEAQAVHSAIVKRRVDNVVRLRNDSVTGSCPT